MRSTENENTSSDVLQKEIQNQSQKEAEMILSQADKEAKRILDAARSEAERIRGDIIGKAENQAANIRKKILSGVHLEVKRQTLRVREELLTKIFKGVEERLHAFRKAEGYTDYLQKLVIEGILALDTDTIQILSGDVEKKLLGHKGVITKIENNVRERIGRKIKLNLSKRVLPEGGVVLVSSDERMLFDNRFPARMKRMKNEMRLEAVKRVME